MLIISGDLEEKKKIRSKRLAKVIMPFCLYSIGYPLGLSISKQVNSKIAR